jgi:hypothetical protein
MRPKPINELAFKSTHNSYQCRDFPLNYPPDVQIDAFGVWALELDPSVERYDGPVELGDNDAGDNCWGSFFSHYVDMIANTAALRFRPVFIYFDIKSWGDKFLSLQDKLERAEAELEGKIGSGNLTGVVVLDRQYVRDRGNHYPTVLELAGKVVIFLPAPQFTRGSPNLALQSALDPDYRLGGTLPSTVAECRVTLDNVEHSILTGEGIPRVCGGATETEEDLRQFYPDGYPDATGHRVIRLDQYVEDWTFEYGAPPNPLVVDGTAQPPYSLLDVPPPQVWFPSSANPVSAEHGTYAFPYTTLTSAVRRAEGNVTRVNPDPAVESELQQRRAGYGWTVLLRAGNYPENLRIGIPLTLQRDDRYDGTVVIGR